MSDRELILLPIPTEDLKLWADALTAVLQPKLTQFEKALDLLSFYDLEQREIVGPNGVSIYDEAGNLIVDPDTGLNIYLNNLNDEVSQRLVPVGGITLWSGTVAAIPSGWALCDGTQGTPDLQDKFIVGAGSTYTPADAGGGDSITLATGDLPAHTHSYQDGDTTYSLGTTSTAVQSGAGTNVLVSATLTSGGGDTGRTSGSVGSGDSIDIRPQYYALAYIMKL